MSREKLQRAIDGALGPVRAAMSPIVPNCPNVPADIEFHETNPTPSHHAIHLRVRAVDQADRHEVASADHTEPARHEMSPEVTECPQMSHRRGNEIAKTNPTMGSLTLRQLAAARLLVAGRGVGQVAQAVGVHRRTIWRWKEQTDFQKEVQKLVNRAVAPKRLSGGVT